LYMYAWTTRIRMSSHRLMNFWLWSH